MRVTKEQLVKGIAQYVENDVIPKMSDDKAMQILLDFLVNTVKANQKLTDMIFENNTVKMFCKCNEDGTYEVEEVFSRFSDSVKKYGYFPIVIPPIRFVSFSEKTLSFTESDIAELKKRIERSIE